MGKSVPSAVLEAMKNENRAALQAMGRAGGKKAGELSKQRADERDLERILARERSEKLQEEFRKRDEEQNFHICPLPD
ncbi:MAG: hypothetical protein RL097_74 [Candidatus Parcubacteria bacterium]|jgi:hypothetical protein